MAEETADASESIRTTIVVDVPSEVRVRDFEAREIDVRLVPWNVVIDTVAGPEMFVRGAFVDADPTQVRLMGLEHEVHMGLGQNGQPRLTRHPVGIATRLDDRDDGEHATFRVAKTVRGDEVLALAAEGIASGVSIEFGELPGGSPVELVGGKKVRVHRKAALHGASTTYRPAYGMDASGSVVLAVRNEGDAPVSETPPVVEAPSAPAIDLTPLTEAIAGQSATMQRSLDAFGERIVEIEERSRRDVRIPAQDERPSARSRRGDWMQTVLQMLSGDRVNDLQMRALDDIITTDSVGVVPDAFLNEMIGVIDPRRPFLQSTRKLDLPPAGMSLVVPKIVTRPETGVQAEEKGDIASNTTSITTATFDAVTIAGGGDISLQLLKRSSPSFLSLYLELLAESYARNAEIQALTALYTGDTPGGTLDPEEANFGQAWAHGAAVGQQVDTLWLSSNGVARFIDAKADGTNAPLYSSIQAGFTAGSGPAGTISGLRPVYVPAMDAVGDVDAIVGPSNGFGWTEDGTYTLQVDVPAKAGRDVAIVGILWFAPMYPSAFTTYQIAS